ncbi:hypothetical protein BKA64DRAFT_728453 [Cadophora sp. MPI-SDFR-AT-0126]|nr:hypothetical protein BKA64DRAFT_728453 [Leotiomycetes sp. MPI-SDFR-AT-0126]
MALNDQYCPLGYSRRNPDILLASKTAPRTATAELGLNVKEPTLVSSSLSQSSSSPSSSPDFLGFFFFFFFFLFDKIPPIPLSRAATEPVAEQLLTEVVELVVDVAEVVVERVVGIALDVICASAAGATIAATARRGMFAFMTTKL